MNSRSGIISYDILIHGSQGNVKFEETSHRIFEFEWFLGLRAMYISTILPKTKIHSRVAPNYKQLRPTFNSNGYNDKAKSYGEDEHVMIDGDRGTMVKSHVWAVSEPYHNSILGICCTKKINFYVPLRVVLEYYYNASSLLSPWTSL